MLDCWSVGAGEAAEGHPVASVNLPYSRLEVRIAALVPRRDVPVVLFDGGDDGFGVLIFGISLDIGKAVRDVTQQGGGRQNLGLGGAEAGEAGGGLLFVAADQYDLGPGTGGHVATTSVFIAGGEAAVIDPGPSLRHGQRVRASLACRFGARVRWVVNTHAHAENVMGNANFAQIAARHSPLQAVLVWRMLARNCPNFVPEPLPDTLAEGIEYGSVAEARAAVSVREGIETKAEDGWTVIAHQPSLSVWSFAPEGALAYPAVIKRWAEPAGEAGSRAMMAMRCEAQKRICDALFEVMALRNGFTQTAFE